MLFFVELSALATKAKKNYLINKIQDVSKFDCQSFLLVDYMLNNNAKKLV